MVCSLWFWLASARNEGFLTLYSGFAPTLVMALPSNALYFTMYDMLRETIERHTLPDSTTHALAPMFAGGAARTIVALAFAPLELIRTKMQAVKSSTSIAQGLSAEIRCGHVTAHVHRCVAVHLRRWCCVLHVVTCGRGGAGRRLASKVCSEVSYPP
jgi:hypothetical protein